MINQKRLATTTLAVLLLTLSLPSPTKAEQLDPAHVPADAKWVIHLDFESFRDSGLFDKLVDHRPEMVKAIHGWLEQKYGIDPPKGFRSATIFSRDYREYTGTVILQADYDATKVEAQLRKVMEHRTTQWQKYTLHTVTLSKQAPGDDGPSGDEQMTVVLLDSDTIVLGSSVDNATAALKLLAGESPSLDGTQSPLLADSMEDAWMYGAAIELGKLREHDIAMPALTQHERITWSFGKRDGKIYEQAQLVAESEEVAKKMRRVLDGIIAYEELWFKDSEPMQKIMQGVELTHEGRTTGFNWQGDESVVLAGLDDALERLEDWKPLWKKHHQANHK